MKKFPIIAMVIAILLIGVGTLLITKSSNSSTPTPTLQPPTGYEYYWGDGCPHCAVVEEFMKTWKGKDKITIEKKEVWKNKANALIFAQRAAGCGINKNELAVPMLVTPEEKCITGDTPIIDHFKGLEL